MMRSIFVFCVVLFSAGTVRAADVTTFTLGNGMEVLVLEDHRAPVVAHMVWYRVGSADEPPGRSGIAHYLEHLMFKGTEQIGPGEFSRVVAANGGRDNAFTSWDYTGYIQRVASDRLELMMEMEADRMVNLQIAEEFVDSERQVVLEERNQRTENEPGAILSEQRRAAQFLHHPYRIPIVGWRHEIEALTREDALSFYRSHYAPNNAILIVAGDVEPDAVFALAEKHYGPISVSPDVTPRERVAEPPQRAERRLHYIDPRAAQPLVIRTYLAPERNAGEQREAAALTLLAEILGGSGSTSVLARKLQFETQDSIYTSAFYSGVSLDDTTFGLVSVPPPDLTLEEAEVALDRAVAEFLEEGVDSEQLDRIKTQLRASEIYRQDDITSLARTYGAALTSGLTVEDVQGWPDLLAEITAEEILEAARRVFDRTNAVTGWMSAPETEEVIQ